jgi:nicotinamide riboside kinase
LEDLCSRTAIENQLRHAIQKEGKKTLLTEIVGDKKLERIRSGALREALRRKDPLVTDIMRRASYLLGLATASVLHVVDPEVIIFGGGVIEACGDFMLPLIEKTAHKVAMPGTGQPLQIVRSELGDNAIVLGGVALLRSRVLDGANPAPNMVTMPKTKPLARPRVQVDKPLKTEFARAFYDEKGMIPEAQDVPKIVAGRMTIEEDAALQANRVLFCDTDVLTTVLYARHYYDTCPPWIERLAHERRYDLTLLTDIDLPWEPDVQRELGHRREELYALFRDELESRRIPYQPIDGNGRARLDAAITAVGT